MTTFAHLMPDGLPDGAILGRFVNSAAVEPPIGSAEADATGAVPDLSSGRREPELPNLAPANASDRPDSDPSIPDQLAPERVHLTRQLAQAVTPARGGCVLPPGQVAWD